MTSARTAKPRPRPARAAARGAPSLFSLADLEAAAGLVQPLVPPTPQYAWPLLAERAGARSVGQAREPLAHRRLQGARRHHLHGLAEAGASGGANGVITATRGNHGQSIALAARRAGLSATILVPHGNSAEKNSGHGELRRGACRAWPRLRRGQGVCGAGRRGARPPLRAVVRRELVKGVATYALELFRAVPDLATVYAPIGMGSGICGLIAARDLLGLKTEIVGVVAAAAPAVALSVEAGRPVPTNSARTFADGMACREPARGRARDHRQGRGAHRARRGGRDRRGDPPLLDRHPQRRRGRGRGTAGGPAQGARGAWRGKRVGLILSGGNIDTDVLRTVLEGRTPAA